MGVVFSGATGDHAPRYFDVLDFVAISLGAACGVPFTIPTNGKGRDYPRLSGPWSDRPVYLLRVLANPPRGKSVRTVFGDHWLTRTNIELIGAHSFRRLKDNGPAPERGGRADFLRAIARECTRRRPTGLALQAAALSERITSALALEDRRQGVALAALPPIEPAAREVSRAFRPHSEGWL